MMRKRKIIGIIGLVLILVIVLFYVVRIRPMVKEYKKIAYDKLANIDEDTFAKLENTKVYGKNGELIGEVNSGSYQYKKISEISKYVQDGYIAVEDKNFKSHHGIDYLATVRAGIKLVLNRGKATQGGSTITQQLVKNSFLSQKKTFTRKIAEFFLAPEIEKMYTKPQIMEYYCNSNYYGNRCYGIGNAASYYFHKNADQLTLSEAALLVGLSNNPSRYDPVTNYNSSIRKRDRVLKHMLDAKVISKTQYQQAKNEKIEIAEYRKNVKPEGYQTSFAIYQATLELMKKNGFEFQYTFQDKEDEKKYKERYQEEYQKYFQKLRNGGYKLYTSFDQECQKALQSSVDHNLRSFTKKKKGKYELQGAAVSIDNETGNIVAVVGGRGQNDQYNRGYLAIRQPGSSIKPLLDYTPAFDSGVYYPSKVIVDRKTSSGPSNADHSYSGSRTIRNAIIHSTNTVAWNVLQKIGVKNGLKYLTNLQFSNLSYLDNKNASAALGGFTHGVRVVDMAKGFATLENGGVYQDNSCIDKIMFKDHEVLKHKNTRKNVYSSASAYMITDCMKDAVKNGTGKNAQVKGQIIAGKTGTTNDYKDAWFCGYSRYYTTSVWVGCDDSKPMDNLTGSSYPSKIFSDYMTKVHKGKIKKDFKMPNTVYRKDGDLFSKDIDDTLHETVLENILKEQIKKAENAVEDFEAFTITDGESAYLLDDKYQKVCTAIMMSVAVPVHASEQATVTIQESQGENREVDQVQSSETTESKPSTSQITTTAERKEEVTSTHKKKQNKKKDNKKEKKVKKLKKTKKKEKVVHVKIKPTISSSYQEQSIKIKKNKEYIGKFIYFNQGDAAWNSSGYGIRAAGCGPTSMAVCISTLTEKWVTPVDTTSWAYEQGYYSSAGSEHRAIPAMAEHWGLKCDGLGTNYQKIKESLKHGRPVVSLMGPGYFTRGGHFMVLTEIDSNDNVTVADVGSRKRSQYKYSLHDVISQSKVASAGGPFWSIYKQGKAKTQNDSKSNKQVLKISKNKKTATKAKVNQKEKEIIQSFYTELSKNLTDLEKELPNSKVLIGKKATGTEIPNGKINQCIYRLGEKLNNGHLQFIATHYYFGEEAILHGDAKSASIDLNSRIQMLDF